MTAPGLPMAIPISNASVNPARSLGSAVYAGGEALSQVWVFWAAPILGGVIGGVVGRWLLEDGRQIEFVDEVNLVLTTRKGRMVTDRYFVYQEDSRIRLRLPILLSSNCIVNHIDHSKFRYTEPGVIGEVVMNRISPDARVVAQLNDEL